MLDLPVSDATRGPSYKPIGMYSSIQHSQDTIILTCRLYKLLVRCFHFYYFFFSPESLKSGHILHFTAHLNSDKSLDIHL
jgi:hypothetical protein